MRGRDYDNIESRLEEIERATAGECGDGHAARSQRGGGGGSETEAVPREHQEVAREISSAQTARINREAVSSVLEGKAQTSGKHTPQRGKEAKEEDTKGTITVEKGDNTNTVKAKDTQGGGKGSQGGGYWNG
jgi:hypothetical protein